MSAVVLSYAPGAGGNHIKNLLCLDHGFANSSDLNPTVYDLNENKTGTVHSIPGRNLHEDLLDRVLDNPDRRWIIHGHWGELAPYRDKINRISNKKFVLITIDQARDQELLMTRMIRLGHPLHNYYISEEQPCLYRSSMYVQSFFNAATQEDVCQIPLYEVWHPDLAVSQLLPSLNLFLGTNLRQDLCQMLHDKWWKLNFHFDFDDFARRLYGQTNH